VRGGLFGRDPALIQQGLGQRMVYRSEIRFRAVTWGFAAGSPPSWDHLEVLLSLLYRLVRCQLGVLSVLVRSDLSRDVELLVLRHENQVLRRQAGDRPRWDHVDRLWPTALSRLVNRLCRAKTHRSFLIWAFT
jgi:putative transposase